MGVLSYRICVNVMDHSSCGCREKSRPINSWPHPWIYNVAGYCNLCLVVSLDIEVVITSILSLSSLLVHVRYFAFYCHPVYVVNFRPANIATATESTQTLLSPSETGL